MALPSTLDAVTAANVTLYLGLASDVTRDAKITELLPIFVSQVKSYCRHDFESKSRVSEYPVIDKSTNVFFTKFRPVTSISSLSENGIALMENTDYWVNNDTGAVKNLRGLWTVDPKKIVISYTGGIALNTVYEVLQPLYEIVGIALGLKTRTYITGEGVEGAVSINSLPEAMLTILDRHQLCRV